jgi:hypothetical protein
MRELLPKRALETDAREERARLTLGVEGVEKSARPGKSRSRGCHRMPGLTI